MLYMFLGGVSTSPYDQNYNMWIKIMRWAGKL